MKRVLSTSLLTAVLASGGAWTARGLHDEIQMDEGVFHVLNATDAQRVIELVFPSGERRSAVVDSGQAVDFRVANTGEGGVSVMADGSSVGTVGYVTRHNPLSVVVVQSEGAVFSQFLRGQGSIP